MEPIISVIIPVYNVEKYLRQCLDSVINQTYRNIEILVVDDGSTDGSGAICEEYLRDPRVQVFHTENHGLSAARNYAIDRARGEYFAFLDSDDWLEERAIETCLATAKEHRADIVAFCFYQEFVNTSYEDRRSKESFVLRGEEILKAVVIDRKLSEDVWNKFYRAELFDQVRYPEGRIFEDYSTTYQLLQKAESLVYIPNCLVHYRNRERSLSNIHTMKSLMDFWTAYDQRFKELSSLSPDYYRVTLTGVIGAVSRMWRWYAGCSKEEQNQGRPLLGEMQAFVKAHRKEILGGDYSRYTKATCRYASTQNPLVLRGLYLANNLYRKSNRNTYFHE